MKHIVFSGVDSKNFDIAILIKEVALQEQEIIKNYIVPLEALGISRNRIIAFSLEYNKNNKAPAKLTKLYCENFVKVINTLSIKTLLVTDATYFKKIIGGTKAEAFLGYIKKGKFKGFEDIDVILSINYQAMFYAPDLQTKLDMSLNTLSNHLQGTHEDLGTNILKRSKYLMRDDLEGIRTTLQSLHKFPEISCDIEAFSLLFHKAGIATIAFAVDKHSGIAIQVDWDELPGPFHNKGKNQYGIKRHNAEVKKLLLEFFESYKGTIIYHNGNYDIKVLIYELFMDDLLDIVGLVKGLEVMYVSIEDTKLITYLATNSTSGNDLKLKSNAFEYTGNYAQEDIKDVCLIQLDVLLEYNIIDCLATIFVKEKNYPIMLRDLQEEVYLNILKPSMKVVTHMELVGMAMDMDKVKKGHSKLSKIEEDAKKVLSKIALIKNFTWLERCREMQKANAKLKTKIKPISDFEIEFNPNSGAQLQRLLYGYMGLPIIDLTKNKQPAVGKETLTKLLNHLTVKFNITEEDLK